MRVVCEHYYENVGKDEWHAENVEQYHVSQIWLLLTFVRAWHRALQVGCES